MNDAAIHVENVTKIYEGEVRALDNVNLTVPRGAIFGLLGPNGAGKSTLINILAGLVNKTAGSASIWGFDIDRDPRNAKASIGIVNQEITFDPFFCRFSRQGYLLPFFLLSHIQNECTPKIERHRIDYNFLL